MAAFKRAMWFPLSDIYRRRHLTHFKKIIRDRSVFNDNQVDTAALEVCVASVAPAEDESAQVEEEGDDDEVHA